VLTALIILDVAKQQIMLKQEQGSSVKDIAFVGEWTEQNEKKSEVISIVMPRGLQRLIRSG
jgi:hypothetical protein